VEDFRQSVTIKLVEHDLLELQQIFIDEDKEAAFEFLKNVVIPRLPQKTWRHCNSNNLNQYL